MSGAPATIKPDPAGGRAVTPLTGSVPVPLAFTDEGEFRAARRHWESVVRSDGKMTLAERLIVLHLGSYAGPDALAWPSAMTLAAELCTSDRHVKRALQKARQRGWLIRRGRRAFGGSVAYALGADSTIASEIDNRLKGQRIIRQIRRDHPETRPPKAAPKRPRIRDTSVPNGTDDDGLHKGHQRPFNGDTEGPYVGTPVSPDPIHESYPSNLGKEASEEEVVSGQHDKSPEPRAIPLSARATGGQQGTTLEAVPLSAALSGALARLAAATKESR